VGAKDFLKAYKFVGGCFRPLRLRKVRCKIVFGFPTRLRFRSQQTEAWWGAASSGVQLRFLVLQRAHPFQKFCVLLTRRISQPNFGTANKTRPGTMWAVCEVQSAHGRKRESLSGYLFGPVAGLRIEPACRQRSSFVQSASATPGTTTASVSVLFSGAQGGGDLNVVVASWNDSTSTIQIRHEFHRKYLQPDNRSDDGNGETPGDLLRKEHPLRQQYHNRRF